MNVPFCDLHLQHEALASAIDQAIERVVHNSSFILGPEVARFETLFASYIGSRYAIGTSNGTTALMIALKALHVERWDEVIVPAMTFFASAEAVAFLGAIPVFVDIDPRTLTMDVAQLRSKITAKTRAILPVHLYGHPADLDGIRGVAAERRIPVLGDCAHAHGATYNGRKVGAIEDAGAFSFYPSKNLGCLGEAGMITTNDGEIARLCRLYRDHGSAKKYEHDVVGTNARMEGLQAAILAVKLPFLDRWNDQRRDVARFFNTHLAGLPVTLPVESPGVRHVYHIYQIRLADRDAAADHLTRRGVSVTLHYPVPMHLHRGFSHLRYRRGDFPVAERLAAGTLSLPCYPGMNEEQLVHVAGAVSEFFSGDAGAALANPGPSEYIQTQI